MKNACGLASKVREEGEGTCSVGLSTSDQSRGRGGVVDDVVRKVLGGDEFGFRYCHDAGFVEEVRPAVARGEEPPSLNHYHHLFYH